MNIPKVVSCSVSHPDPTDSLLHETGEYARYETRIAPPAQRILAGSMQ